jgi:oxaloacetate decarboxylase gamma subunit
MIIDGLKLMVMGMGTVFVFLTLMVLAINGTARPLAPCAHLLAERGQTAKPRAKRKTAPAPADGDARVVAAISAAVAAHRASRGG